MSEAVTYLGCEMSYPTASFCTEAAVFFGGKPGGYLKFLYRVQCPGSYLHFHSALLFSSLQYANDLERVVLRWDLMCEEARDEGNFLENILQWKSAANLNVSSAVYGPSALWEPH